MAFSLDQFEWLVHRHRNEEAAQALMGLIRDLNIGNGRIPELGEHPLAGRQDPRDVRYVTRLAAAIGALFADESFQLSPGGFRLFAMAHRWLSAIFGASAFGNADHIIRAFNLNLEDAGKKFEVQEKDLLKFALLYSIDSEVQLDIEALWAKDRVLASALFLGILSSRVVLSEAAHEKREKILEWFPQKLSEMQLSDLPIGFLHDAWMHCTYAVTPRKHDIKEALNKLIRTDLLRNGFADDTRDRSKLSRDKPVVVVILDHFHSRHVIFRWFSRLLAGLRPAFRLVGICIQKPDEPAAALFDKHILIELPPDRGLGDALHPMLEAVREEAPDIVFHLGVGMSLQGIFLANLRLAPIQIASIGHPATTKHTQIDYFMVDDLMLNSSSETAVADFSERLLLAPPSAFALCRPPTPDFERQQRKGDGVVNIAVVLSLMKLNPPFLRACREVMDRCKVPTRLHVLLGGSYGVTTMYVDNLIRRTIPDAIIYPQLTPEQYYYALGAADMCLEPFPFANATTIIDYASEGVPSVCLVGDPISARQSACVMRRIGLPEWLITQTPKEYIEKAAMLASDALHRETIRSYLRDAFQPSKVDSLDIFQGDPKLVCRWFQALLKGRRGMQATESKILKIA